LFSVTLWVVWLLLNNTAAPGHLVLGGLLALLIPRLVGGFFEERIRLRRPVLVLKLLGVVLADIVVANLRVARLVLGPRSALRPRFVRIPLDITHPRGVNLLAAIITLTPGTVSADLGEDRRTLLVHGLAVPDERAVIAAIKARYEVPLREIFR
jgi:multicomponent K+:H+ antiporter subunit E